MEEIHPYWNKVVFSYRTNRGGSSIEETLIEEFLILCLEVKDNYVFVLFHSSHSFQIML